MIDAGRLSTAHISPFIRYADGGSLLTSCRGGDCAAVGGGRRGVIKGFSYGSRRRLMQTIATISRTADLPLFVTLTYPAVFPGCDVFKRHIDIFFKRFARSFPSAGLIWKQEPQERGAPHAHILVWGVELTRLMVWVPVNWFQIAGGGDKLHLLWHQGLLGHGNKHCVQQVRSFKGVWSYASKYLGKTFEAAGWGKKWTGRYWGVIARQNIPFVTMRYLMVTRRFAVQVMRYQRRFKRVCSDQKRKRFASNGRSLTIFCDGSQWVERLYAAGVSPGVEFCKSLGGVAVSF